jgi:hypothetical protein
MARLRRRIFLLTRLLAKLGFACCGAAVLRYFLTVLPDAFSAWTWPDQRGAAGETILRLQNLELSTHSYSYRH